MGQYVGGTSIKLITVDEICYFKADTKYTLVVTPSTESLIRKPIKELVDELDPDLFWQIHRSTLVNVTAWRRSPATFAGSPRSS